GVGFSENPFRWNARIRREHGFLRLVWGMGTRAVERIANDYPRLAALSHPHLRPESTAQALRKYSQHYVDVINLEENQLQTLPIHSILGPDYPYLRFIASLHRGDFIQEILSNGMLDDPSELVITFNTLLQDRKFTKLMLTALMRLEEAYETPVDIEFTVK